MKKQFNSYKIDASIEEVSKSLVLTKIQQRRLVNLQNDGNIRIFKVLKHEVNSVFLFRLSMIFFITFIFIPMIIFMPIKWVFTGKMGYETDLWRDNAISRFINKRIDFLLE